MKIPLMKNTFYNEKQTKKALTKFIIQAPKLSMGQQCANFEKEFAIFQNAKYAVLFNSGGSANLAMLQSLKNIGLLKDGDNVGFSALTWSTNVMPIIQLNLQPIPVDCDTSTLNVMSKDLKQCLLSIDIQVMFITNALGFAGDLDKIQQICNKKGIILIEDNCESLGTELFNGKTGSFGRMASFSFYVQHHLSTIEGGMVCTNNKQLAEMLKIVRANGWDRDFKMIKKHAKFIFYDLGYNLKPTEITGFLGCYQLQFLRSIIDIRQTNYNIFESIIVKNSDLLIFNHSHILLLSSFVLPILCKTLKIKRQYLIRFSNAGIETRPMIAGNIQNQPFYRKYISNFYDLPNTNKIDNYGFYCGNYPELTKKDIQIICNCLKKKGI